MKQALVSLIHAVLARREFAEPKAVKLTVLSAASLGQVAGGASADAPRGAW